MTRERDTVQISVRVPRALVVKADALAERSSKAGLILTRADALRIILATGLRAMREDIMWRKA